jgi:hypothetical protein
MAGRTWLPDEVRAVAKARMVAVRGQTETDEVTRLVGEYQHLTDPGEVDADEAWEVLQALHRLFEDTPPRTGGNCTVMEGGEPNTDGDQGTPYPTADEDPNPGEGDDADDHHDDDDDADDADDADGGDGGDDAGDDGDDAGDGDGDDEGESPTPTNTGRGGGAGGGPSTPPDPTAPIDQGDVRRRLKHAASDAIERDEEAKGDLDSVLDAVEYGRPGDAADGEDPVGRNVEATDAARRLHREVADALLDLKDDTEPGWDKRVDSGRLNVRRYAAGVDYDEVFDRYQPGMMDASEMEVVLLLDVSSSMHAQVHRLAEATWAIRHAVDDIEGRITVITYETGPHRILADPNVRPDGRMFVPNAYGGTQPQSAIREAYRLLTGAEAKNRLFIVLTDGDWFSTGSVPDRNDELIDALNAAGVTTVSVLLTSSSYGGANHHHCQYGARIDDPADLARLFRSVALDRMHAAWHR